MQTVALDPCATYRAAIRQALSNARIVADHFHLLALANKAFIDVPKPGSPKSWASCRPTSRTPEPKPRAGP